MYEIFSLKYEKLCYIFMKLLVSSVVVSDWHILMFYKTLILKYVIKEVMDPKNMKAKVRFQTKKIK